jgi:hypothetical protein
MIRALNLTMMMAPLLAVSAQGAEPSYHPGGEEVKKAVEARRNYPNWPRQNDRTEMSSNVFYANDADGRISTFSPVQA